MNEAIEFEAMILDADNGRDVAFVKVPFDVKKELGSSRPKVRATFDNSVEYRGIISKMGTPFHILTLRKDVRSKLAKTIGEMVTVKIEAEGEEEVVELPIELEKALTVTPKLRRFFDELSPQHQRDYATFISNARKDESRMKRVNKVIKMLSNGKKKIK